MLGLALVLGLSMLLFGTGYVSGLNADARRYRGRHRSDRLVVKTVLPASFMNLQDGC